MSYACSSEVACCCYKETEERVQYSQPKKTCHLHLPLRKVNYILLRGMLAPERGAGSW